MLFHDHLSLIDILLYGLFSICSRLFYSPGCQVCVSSGFGHLCAPETRQLPDHSKFSKKLDNKQHDDEDSNETLRSPRYCHYRDMNAWAKEEASQWPLANVKNVYKLFLLSQDEIFKFAQYI